MSDLEALLNGDGIIAECSRIDSRRRLQVVRRGFGQAVLGISPKPPLHDAGWYADSWDFPSVQVAFGCISALESRGDTRAARLASTRIDRALSH